jgi:AcrR family transcriptional regulator
MKAFYYRLLGEDNPLLRYPELYEAALDEFSQNDFEDASLNNILKAANMSKGSLYHNFGDKYGLFIALMDRIVCKKTDFFLNAMKKRPREADFFQTAKYLIIATMQFLQADDRLYHVLSHNIESNEEFKKNLIELFPHNASLEGGFASLVQTALEKGQIDSQYSSTFITGVLQILTENIHRLLPVGHSAEEIERTSTQLIDMLKCGMVPIRKEDD